MAHFTTEEKIIIAGNICKTFADEDCTIQSACEAHSIIYRTFKNWCDEISEISEVYKKAKVQQENNFFENILKPKSRKSLLMLIEPQTIKETVSVYRPVQNDDGTTEDVLFEKRVTKKKALPNPTAVIFASKGAYPGKFVDYSHNELSGKVEGDGWFMQLPLEKRLEILRIFEESKINGGTNSNT